MGHPWTSPINIYIYGVFNGKKSSTNDYKCEIFHRHKKWFPEDKSCPSKQGLAAIHDRKQTWKTSSQFPKIPKNHLVLYVKQYKHIYKQS